MNLARVVAVSHGERALWREFAGRDIAWHASLLRVMTRTCSRAVPFATPHVVARITFLSVVGMYSFCRGKRPLGYHVIGIVHEFLAGTASWLEVVRGCREVQRGMELSDHFTGEVLRHLAENAHHLMVAIDTVPGDLAGTFPTTETSRRRDRRSTTVWG